MRAPPIALALALAPAPRQDAAPSSSASAPAPERALRVLVPWDDEDVARLEKWLAPRAKRAGFTTRVDAVDEPLKDDLVPGSALLAYETGELAELASDGALQPWPVATSSASSPVASASGPTLRLLAWESWAPIWRSGGLEDLPEIDSFARLLAPELRGHVLLREVTSTSAEGLLLAELARVLGLKPDLDLDRLVLASSERGTLVDSTMPAAQLLAMLPLEAVTLAPVRATIAARRRGLKVTFGVPKEGFFARPLGVAITTGTSADTAAWIGELFTGAAALDLCRALELEPADELARADPEAAAQLPEWMRATATHRHAIDPAKLTDLRPRLAALYAAAPSRFALPDVDWFERLFDGMCILAIPVVLFLVLRRVGKSRRDRDGRRLV